MTLEEEVRPQLRAPFERAGLEITLRTLADWCSDEIGPTGEIASTWWWVHEVTVSLIRNAYRVYERREFVDEES